MMNHSTDDLKRFEELLLERGYNWFTPYEKNNLIALLAVKNNLIYSQVTDEYILDYHKKLKTGILKEICEEEIVKGFTATNGHFYRTNRDDQINMIGQKDELSEDSTITVVPWKTEDTGYINHTREEWMKVYVEAFAHKKEKLFKYDMLKGQVLSATTHEEVVGIKFDSPIQDTIEEDATVDSTETISEETSETTV
jgi:hypothetical protein